jgi:hypothetical protein
MRPRKPLTPEAKRKLYKQQYDAKKRQEEAMTVGNMLSLEWLRRAIV